MLLIFCFKRRIGFVDHYLLLKRSVFVANNVIYLVDKKVPRGKTVTSLVGFRRLLFGFFGLNFVLAQDLIRGIVNE